MKFYDMEVEEVYNELKSSNLGLSLEEVNSRLESDGFNELENIRKRSNFSKFLDQFKDLMIIVLILAALFSFILSIINNEPFTDSIIIIAIVILNAILGFIQELKADKAIESLKKMQTTDIKVRRNNKICLVDSRYLVKGDILILEAGDNVPADCRIVSTVSLKVSEAPLTGEAEPVLKQANKIAGDTILSERTNMIYSGTSVVYGKCEAIVCEVGMNTEFGKIANSLNKEIDKQTPLQEKIDNISKVLSIIIGIIILVMFIIGIIKKIELLEIIMLAISLAVAAIPEGLPAVITIILSLGMKDLALKKAIVRKMASVETLGSTEVICSDKTGTITENKMAVKEVYFNDKIYNNMNFTSDNILLKTMILNNDAVKNNDSYIGDPTEIALYKYCEDIIDIPSFRSNNKRIYEIPFDSLRKMMSTINKSSTGLTLYTKGSFDSLILHCSYIYLDGNIIELDQSKKNELKMIENLESSKAYRIIAYAYKEVSSDICFSEELEDDLIFVGMTASIDPPRSSVKESISLCKSANIKPVMITGDSLSTAKAIAREVGILENDKEAITGLELDKLSKQELIDSVSKYSVYARVSPTNKLDIVNAWKENGKVVAMTGDGVNDAPALKEADIGVGMGITGTEVSKSVSDIILADDSFSTIVVAVREGRRIFDNIRNVLVYLLAGNIAEVIVVFICMIFGKELFLPIQLLYINLVTDSVPAIALAFEKEANDIMQRDIRKKDKQFFTPFLISKMLVSAILKSVAILLVYFLSLNLFNIDIATTMAFLTLVLLEMIYAYSCRNLKEKKLGKNFFGNKYMDISVLILVVLQIIVFVTPIKNIFSITNLNFIQVVYCVLIVLIVYVIDELSKDIIIKLFKD